ncbi:hypothetical protein NKOR_00585 [Candidatus Nitrosopumilus koreensis AR1]|uniref:Carboxypeptidase regulatory-like domain-containing protein n=1 Tax=Candidatus Nitrosopumilus koreensis AR1 TaxID=1229908 RepID=K0B552_9ARCH|nr:MULTISPECIES: hypothetical protein [Nitrosopumilus]AFS80035.1 hypothetical protein NKOR_00585 [Candidatus Nitrosopumilus koreensis AR1]
MLNPVIYAGIACGSIVAILGIFIALDANSASQLQFTAVENEDFDFMSLSMDSTYAVCNPTGFPTSFDKIYAQLYYKNDEVADFTIWGSSIPAGKAVDVDGRIDINAQTVLQMFLGAFAGAFAGQTQEFDEEDVTIILKVEKSLLGFIPYTYEKQMSSGNLDDIQKFFVSTTDAKWDCDYSPKQQQDYEERGFDTSKPLSENIERESTITKINQIKESKENYRKTVSALYDWDSIWYDEENNVTISNKFDQILGVYEDYPTSVCKGDVVSIRGKLLTSEGIPIRDYLITLDEEITLKRLDNVRTDSDGNFEFLWVAEHVRPAVTYSPLGKMSLEMLMVDTPENFIPVKVIEVWDC